MTCCWQQILRTIVYLFLYLIYYFISAFIVRYLTGKYIGEYDPYLEGIFKRKKIIKSKEIIIEIKDTIGGVGYS